MKSKNLLLEKGANAMQAGVGCHLVVVGQYQSVNCWQQFRTIRNISFWDPLLATSLITLRSNLTIFLFISAKLIHPAYIGWVAVSSLLCCRPGNVSASSSSYDHMIMIISSWSRKDPANMTRTQGYQIWCINIDVWMLSLHLWLITLGWQFSSKTSHGCQSSF